MKDVKICGRKTLNMEINPQKSEFAKENCLYILTLLDDVIVRPDCVSPGLTCLVLNVN